MTTITQVIEGTIRLYTVGQTIYRTIAGYMDAMENQGLSGIEKFKWVMAKAEQDILSAGKSWEAWKGYISEFITTAKMLYNFSKGIM